MTVTAFEYIDRGASQGKRSYRHIEVSERKKSKSIHPIPSIPISDSFWISVAEIAVTTYGLTLHEGDGRRRKLPSRRKRTPVPGTARRMQGIMGKLDPEFGYLTGEEIDESLAAIRRERDLD